MKLNKEIAQPLYQQLEDYIREGIESGDFLPNQRIPSEKELGEKFSISRMTVRKALTRLVYEGLLYSRQGKGTFVQKPKVQQDIDLTLGFQEKMRTLGLETKTILLDKDILLPDSKMRKQLDIGTGDKIVRIKRLRIVEETPVALQTCVLPLRLFPGIETLDLEGSITTLLKETYHYKLRNYRASMQAVPANEQESQYLEVPEKFPLMLVEGRTLAEGDQPVRYTKNIYRGDKFKFIINKYDLYNLS